MKKICSAMKSIRDKVNQCLALFGLVNLRSQFGGGFEGKDCFVLGSAPNPDLTLFQERMALVAVNGSAVNARRLGLPPPVMTVVDFELLDNSVNLSKETRSVIIKNRLLQGMDLGILVSTQSNGSQGGNPDILLAQYTKYIKIYKHQCRAIVHHVTGTKLLENDVHGLLSRGAFAIAICSWLGARSITFAGFSLFCTEEEDCSPHFYYDMDIKFKENVVWKSENKPSGVSADTRSHSLADCALISQLVLRGQRICSKERDFLPVIQNWGCNPPNWAKR